MRMCFISSGRLAAKPVVPKKKALDLPFAIGDVFPLAMPIKMKI